MGVDIKICVTGNGSKNEGGNLLMRLPPGFVADELLVAAADL